MSYIHFLILKPNVFSEQKNRRIDLAIPIFWQGLYIIKKNQKGLLLFKAERVHFIALLKEFDTHIIKAR